MIQDPLSQGARQRLHVQQVADQRLTVGCRQRLQPQIGVAMTVPAPNGLPDSPKLRLPPKYVPLEVVFIVILWK